MTLISSAFNPPSSAASGLLSGVPCDPSVVAGDFVRMESGTAVKASAESIDTSNVLGLVEQVTEDALCSIRVSGISSSVFSGLDTAHDYYLSETSPGQITTVVPVSAGRVVLKLGQPYDATRLIILKGSRIIRA